jgi:hypothetical protein
MSLQVELKKSAVSQKLPLPSDLALGEIALNYNADGPFLTCKDTAGNIRKLNRVWIAATAPSNPTAGDPWLDTSGATALLRIYDGSTWTVAVNVPLATTSTSGTVQLASSADITNGTAGKIVDAAQLSSKVSGDISTALGASPLFLNSINLSGNATISGNLVVNGTTTTVDSTNLSVTDRNIEIGVVSVPSDTTANTGGITLKGATDKTIQWLDATDSWTFSEHVDLASGKTYKINGTDVLTATSLGSGVTGSSLTSVGTIGTGVWQGTAIVDTYLATISTAGKVSNSATTATEANTPSTIVARDSSGDFSAGTITAALAGNADTATAATTATKLSSARTFALTGDVTGTVNSDLTTGASIAASIGSEVIVNADISPSAGITYGKLQDVSATDKLLGRSSAGAGDIEEIACTAAGRALLDDADAAAQRVTLGVEIGVDVQAHDADTAKTDVAQTYTAAQRGSITALTDAATIAVDFADSNFFSVTLDGNRTLANPSNMVAGQSGAIFITQDAVTGGRTLSYDTYWEFAGGIAPTLSSATNAVDVLVYMVRSSTAVVGHLISNVQ